MLNKPKTLVPIDFLVAIVILFFVVKLRLLPALLGGLLVHELVAMLAPRFWRGTLETGKAKLLVVAMIATAIITILALFGFGFILVIKGGSGNVSHLLQKMASIISESRTFIPEFLYGYIPVDINELKSTITNWLREHADELQLIGKEIGVVLVQVLVGMIIGALIALQDMVRPKPLGPLGSLILEHLQRFSSSFRNVVFAQIKIAAVNATLTAVYLAVLLPLFGIELPLVKTMVILTFLLGLIPVLGNLASNTIIVVVSMSHSPQIAIASLAYLVIIHKLEYFLNAKIIGHRIHAASWEILLAMLVMEAIFGLQGVIAAPIFYAYLKRELTLKGLI
ncbi:AI-2E family transporter [Leeia sp. TBRC 13508]|uniref:AI-2E family transporter n=1 Tax=Leeia speluncae TaxID=2884804 RepID=A0ABS8D8C2_9NEIS|nr:AI-2E family transporter [Leeia speluncae]MCB6183888.1 AI-2E family transporter [Leeia speluncae]